MFHVTAKLAGMRKPQEFVVYPVQGNDPDYVKVQSDKAIGRFNRHTGAGVLNWRGSSPKYNPHLSPALGAEEYQFPRDFVLMCEEVRPNSGDLIGWTPETGSVYVA